ncbi:MAG: phage gp6-like head-tail connector protein [Chloroflexota bacterium]
MTVEQLAAFKSMDADSDANDEELLGRAITAASRAIDDHTNRQFGKVDDAEERTYLAEYRPDKGRWVVTIDDLQTIADLAVDIDGTAVTGHRFAPLNAVPRGRAWTRLEFSRTSSVVPTYPDYEVAVTALWGWSAVPAAVEEACLLQASRLDVRRGSPFGVAGSPDQGNELRLLAKLDPDVAVTLRPYVRPRRVA